ncbi:MAG: flagellar transcriptional regulator FlhC [Chromatiaceae bacterium]|nr:flagellar transcriptional regulator FlhC [Chromatiaceae bacterium]MCP5443737.1 flagellar transcriptional regulator FlhC [Chromatiaceae bacterium]
MRLDLIEREYEAIELIKRGMRISVVSRITEFSPKVLRSLSREVHGHSPRSGQLPSTSRMLSKRSTQATATLFTALYRAQAGSGIFDAIALDHLLAAHERYLAFSAGLRLQGLDIVPIDITQAWVLARDIRSGVASFRYCHACHLHYLFIDDARVPEGCPICALKRQYAR